MKDQENSRFVKLIQKTKAVKYSNEIALLNQKPQTTNNRTSILFYTTFKCASVYVTKILRKLVKENGIIPINWNGYVWETGKPKKDLQLQIAFDRTIFRPCGYFYGCLREFNEWKIADIDHFKKILMLRDPRDVLTSLYFSHAYSHAIPFFNQQEILSLREKALSMTIDQYVIENIPKYLRIYQAYCKNLLKKPNLLFVTYEKMVTDFDRWLDSIIDFLDVQVSFDLLTQIKKEADFTVKEENIYAHKRQVIPGEYQRKLNLETIKILNYNFSEILDLLGYSK